MFRFDALQSINSGESGVVHAAAAAMFDFDALEQSEASVQLVTFSQADSGDPFTEGLNFPVGASPASTAEEVDLPFSLCCDGSLCFQNGRTCQGSLLKSVAPVRMRAETLPGCKTFVSWSRTS